MTFGIDLCYIVTPLLKQAAIVEEMIHHWSHGYGSQYNPARGEALRRVRVKPDLAQVLEEMAQRSNTMLVGTSARERPDKAISHGEFLKVTETGERQPLLLFGTAWGLTDETVDMCERMLAPIRGNNSYNHLSLRVALGILLDRIFGERGGQHERNG
jgi:hypothetical protein